ncbi:EAL domain-containing protein [Legionella shakespearei]|uniref:GGDEF domain-containing sensory box protein n=1 Tax=Legionella shakespearei DSM 23087 TaxID=1122169 RepID=A0A0W0Z7E9_9GAMM|nr:EAL domain-containing protein [Legionella shakespearei]KTD65052.1 GGDEF domain-containing sensory box protein [Legionella shakespearei DSM 23087]
MVNSKNKQKTTSSKKIVSSQHLDNSVEHLIENAQDGIIAFDIEGKIIAINQEASKLFRRSPDQLIGQYVWQQLKSKTISRKRQFIQARKYFKLAKDGIAQQFTWLERNSQKPVFAYNIMINKAEIHGEPVFFAKLINILQAKIIEWVLWSLAQISNHHEINEVIDEILRLVSNVFAADYASVSLIDNHRIAHAVSYFEAGEKKDNINYPLAHSPCHKVVLKKTICYFNDVQRQFPKDHLLQIMGVNCYLAGPIYNAQNEVVGLMNVLTKGTIERDEMSDTLFRLFLGRINLEIERLLNQRKLQFLASIPQQDPNPVMRILPSGDVIFANDQGKKIIKYWMKHYSGLPERLLKDVHKAQTSNQVIRMEIEVECKIYLFTLIWMSEFNQINIYGTDISQLKSTEKDMLNLARFDALTQIANRQYFEEKLIEKIHEHSIENRSMALLLVDFDNFKTINDTLGHPIGDRLLKAATKRMVRCIRQEDFIARLGGDEFIVLLNKSDTNAAVMVAEKLINVLARTFQFGEYTMRISASVGIALYPETGNSTSDLLKHADIAMYQAKKAGKNSYAVFSKSVHYIQDKRNETIRKELKFAAAKNELFIEYQPQIDIISNKIIGFEALLRWLHPQEGLILPNEFISVAEQTGCIHIISQWMIEQSLQDYNILIHKDFNPRLSINVSLSQLSDARFIDSLNDNLLQFKINKEKIILDISERTIAPYFKQISKSMKKIHQIGIKICLDNFGSPQISLPKLLALPLDCMKLDQQLLTCIETKAKHRMLLKGIISLAGDLHIEIIQKGVETEEQHQIIKSLGCRYAQGYYYCKPISITELQHFIKNYPQG